MLAAVAEHYAKADPTNFTVLYGYSAEIQQQQDESFRLVLKGPENEVEELDYDGIIGADAHHSVVKRALAIKDIFFKDPVYAASVIFEGPRPLEIPYDPAPGYKEWDDFIKLVGVNQSFNFSAKLKEAQYADYLKSPEKRSWLINFAKGELLKIGFAEKWIAALTVVKGKVNARAFTFLPSRVEVAGKVTTDANGNKKFYLLAGDATHTIDFFSEGRGANLALCATGIIGSLVLDYLSGEITLEKMVKNYNDSSKIYCTRNSPWL